MSIVITRRFIRDNLERGVGSSTVRGGGTSGSSASGGSVGTLEQVTVKGNETTQGIVHSDGTNKFKISVDGSGNLKIEQTAGSTDTIDFSGLSTNLPIQNLGNVNSAADPNSNAKFFGWDNTEKEWRDKTLVAGTGVSISSLDNQITISFNGSAISLDNLSDVNDLSSVSDGQFLRYVDALDKWSAHTFEMSSISNVDLSQHSGAQDGDVLTYQSADSKWVSKAPTAGSLAMNNLTDVAAASPLNNQILKYNTSLSRWEDEYVNMSELGDVDTAGLADGYILVYNFAAGEWQVEANTSTTPTLDDVTTQGNTTSNNITVGDINLTGDIRYDGVKPSSSFGSKAFGIKSNSNAEIILDHTDTGVSSDIGILSFERNGDHLAHIRAFQNGSTTAAGISFHTQDTGGSYANLSSNERMRITSTGKVLINRTLASTYDLDVKGSVRIEENGDAGITLSDSNTAWRIKIDADTNELDFDYEGATKAYIESDGDAYFNDVTITSDRRLKTNINPVEDISKVLKALKPVTYSYKGRTEKRIGFIAQEVKEILPDMVTKTIENYYGLHYNDVASLAIAGWQNHDNLITSLKREITKLKRRITTLERKGEKE